ncbi:MAG: coproporphyrinogen-III oxidase family protein [Kofleriaceae bacterium]
MELGVYVHYPWCRKLCPYCDFAVEVGPPEHGAYARAITDEIARRADKFPGELVSIYFGGGTPSLWDPECLAKVIEDIRRRWNAPNEVTIEANPTDCTDERLAAWRAAGIDRVSIGVQSLVADELVVLGRDHRFGDGPAALQRVLGHGLRASCDFILGTPTPKSYDWSWLQLADTGVGHLSVYELTIEERTQFGTRVAAGKLIPRDEDTLAELYERADRELGARGFEHYEISSYARPGQRAIHNSLYWRGLPFLGVGVGAASLEVRPDGSGERATNPRRWRDYAAGVPPTVIESDPDDMAADRLWLGMRTKDGVREGELPAEVQAWVLGEGLATRVGGRICPTLRGFLMADRIAARIAEAL